MNKRIKEAAAAIVKKAVFTVYLFTVIAPGGMYGQGRMDGSRGVKREASEIVAQKVIGQEGGVLEAEGVRFSIPEGAVEAEVEITISRLYEVAEGGKRIESYLVVLRGYIGGRPALIRGYKG